MSNSHRQIRVRGMQCEQIDADLLAQIVVMLGRQLATEAAAEDAAPGSRDDPQAGGNEVRESWA